MLPSFRLHERLRAVTALYPKAMESFLDLGCCRGYFVLEAAGRSGCRTATGIDVYEPFVSTSNRVCRCLDVAAARFYLAGLEDVAGEPESYGGPFNVVLLLGTYHYLYWGSRLCPSAYHDHREILSRLFRVCAGRLIFSARLEVDRLPGSLRADARASGKASDYSEARFLGAAEEFFDVRQAGRLGRDSLLVMSTKGTAEE
ncbi:MAG: class I SAM-dependent methyltransferase [Planctomycetota bacterium]